MAVRLNDMVNGILNFLGLPEIQETEKRNGAGNGGTVRTAGKVKKGYSPEEDEFDDGPQVKRVPRNGGNTRGSRPQGSGNAPLSDDDFEDADRIWNSDDTTAAPRPNYTGGKRTNSNPQTGAANGAKGYNTDRSNPYGFNAGKNSGARRDGYQDTKYYGGESMNNSANREPQESAHTTYQVKFCRIKSVEECQDVIRNLLAKKTISLNLEDLDTVQQQRVIDMMVGATFAIGAKMTRSGTGCWMLTPSNVDVDDKQAMSSRGFI